MKKYKLLVIILRIKQTIKLVIRKETINRNQLYIQLTLYILHKKFWINNKVE